MTSAPSAILTRAADLIRDRADAATPGPWSTVRRVDGNGNLRQADFTRPPVAEGCAPQTRAVRPHETPDYEWIALMSPAVAPAIESILREAAESAAHHVPIWQDSSMDGLPAPKRTAAEVAELVEHHYGPALALARAVLGEKEETTDGR